jgi:hypothetical protein
VFARRADGGTSGRGQLHGQRSIKAAPLLSVAQLPETDQLLGVGPANLPTVIAWHLSDRTDPALLNPPMDGVFGNLQFRGKGQDKPFMFAERFLRSDPSSRRPMLPQFSV